MFLRSFLNVFIAIMLVSCSTATTFAENSAVNIKPIVKDPETAIVDVRIPEQFEEGSAQNAVNIPLATINDNLEFFRKQKNTVIYCNSGKQAQEAMEILNKNGIENVYYGKTLKNIKAIQAEK